MERREWLRLWPAGLVVGLGGCSLPGVQEMPQMELAPAFRAKTMAGESVTNESVAGKPVLIQFWATWCGMCRRDEPAVESLRKEFAEQGLQVLAVSVGETRETVERYLEASPRQVQLILEEETNLAALFPVEGFPHYVLLDRGGFIAGQQRGSGGEAALRKLLAKADLA